MVDLNVRVARLSAGTRALLLRTASVVVLASMIGPEPASAQLAARRGPAATAPVIAPRAVPGQIRSDGANRALDRSVAVQARVDDIQRYVKQARAAAGGNVVADGLQGLVIARGITSEALAAGALRAARDSTGRLTWQGAALPVESAANGKSLVTITQNEARAILSWDRFDVGSNTILQFDQNKNKDWVAVNRVVDPTASPSRILGSIKADGTVIVLNRNGVMFGNGAQVNVNSLLASSLEIGNFVKAATRISNGTSDPGFVGLSLAERNINFIQNGLLQPSVAQGNEILVPSLVSAEIEGFHLAASLGAAFGTASRGGVTVERGANITAGKGGFVILAAPNVSNDGILSAAEGQVSLQAGMAISVTPSTGAANAADPQIRGLILRTPFGNAGNSAINSGLIDTPRGHASLGAGLTGSVTNAGLIAATTSVSRNGTISLMAGTVTLAGADVQGEASGLVITPDKNGETVPQGSAAEPANFKASRIQIGGAYLNPFDGAAAPLGELGPSAISFGKNALIYAPNATVDVGGKAGDTFVASRFPIDVPGSLAALATRAASKIDIAAGVLIDVGGVKDVLLDASRNSLLIDPVKRNELRDTPNYREINATGQFTLNGTAVYVDPRISGVRDDGVAYIGSPLIEAGSAASQIGVTAAELMTKGGNLTLNVGILEAAAPLSATPKITIHRDAALDFEGGWVRYADGIVRTSRLLAADGRIIDIGRANPNDIFVAIGDGFTEVQAKFGISRTFGNSILQGGRFEFGYDEGRDAGSLIVSASAANIDGVLRGSSYAGARQVQNGRRPSGLATIAGDKRGLQARASELPSGGYLRIGAFDRANVEELTGDIVIGSAGASAPAGAIRLSDAALSAAGLSALSVRTSASFVVSQGSNLQLANGGLLDVEAGRAIRFDGNVTSASGFINARTTDFGSAGSISIGSGGSPFRSEDDLAAFYTVNPGLTPFDITVTGNLSTAGLWVNDFLAANNLVGNAWSDGGSISLAVAPSVFVGIGSISTNLTEAADFSGSIRIAGGALLHVSSGGNVTSDGSLDLTAKGGNIALINQTRYASVVLTDTDTGNTGNADLALGGKNQTVTFTPYNVGQTSVVPALVPARQVAEVVFDVGSLKGYGFSGGGTFQLVAPDIAMGSASGGKGPRIGLDFLQRTGFGTLDLSAFKSRIISGLFSNGNAGNSAFLETSSFKIGFGETLDLTQAVLPSLLDTAIVTQLTSLATGANVTTILTPAVPLNSWDRKAANLKLGGLTELDVAAGGTISGAAGATIDIPRLYSAGTIRIAGGRITQNDTLQSVFSGNRVVGVRDTVLGGGGLSDVLGGVSGQIAGFDENALSRIDAYPNIAGLQRITNGQLFSLVDPNNTINDDINLVFTGRVALNEGIHLTASSITDLSGIALYDPRASFFANGTQQRVGRIIGGGLISTSAFGSVLAATGYASPIDPSNKLNAEAGALINLNGASGQFDERISQTSFGMVSHWSDAGRLVVGNGALLTGANLTAFGGDDGDTDVTNTRANGGLLDWVAPTIRQSDDGSANNGSALFAQQIMDSGFQSLVARGGFTTVGDVTLNLGKSFIATTDFAAGGRSIRDLVINAAAGSNAAINAPYIRLSSSNKTIGGQGVSTAAGHISFGAQAIDIVGAVEFNVSSRTDPANRGSVRLNAVGDIRLIGSAALPDAEGRIIPGLSGQLISNGDLLIKAAQLYATTGTGNLQQLIENRRAGRPDNASPYVMASSNINGLVKIEGNGGIAPDTPYSAGSHLSILGAHIEQNGVLRAPLGLLDIGSNQSTLLVGTVSAPATSTLTFGSDSLTSVSARTNLGSDQSLNIPYGTTTDTIEYFFSPGTNAVITTTPVGELRLAGKDISIASDAMGEVRVDARGGGDVFAFEFIPGTGGSRDVLDRFNPDVFSGNDGLQFADGRQVYALLPKNSANIALFDPIYSADYSSTAGGDLYGINAGISVTLDAAPGLAAGEYLLLPARYALLPGALRIVENVGAAAPTPGSTTTLLDGSMLVGGVYSTAGVDFAQSQRRSFTIQSKDVLSKYSRIELTSGTTAAIKLADRSNSVAPLLPRDAARVVLAPLTSLKVAGAFATAPAAGGVGAQVDVGGTKIRIAATGALTEAATQDYVLLTTDTLANFNADSLSIGALRNNNANGTTRLDVVTNMLLVDNNVNFSAPELLLAVGGPGSLLSIEDAPKGGTGAVLTAVGILNDKRTGDYIINANGAVGSSSGIIDPTGSGSLIRLANGPERLVTREGDFLRRSTLLPARLDIGAGATLEAAAITLDTSRTFAIDRTARIGAGPGQSGFVLALSADALRIGSLTFRPEIEAQFGLAERLTLRSPDIVNFNPGTYRYNNLTIDAAGIGLAQPIPLTALTGDVQLIADHVVLRNSSKDIGACKDVGARFCGAVSNLTVDATDITFGSGQFRTYGFDAGLAGTGVTLSAREGMYVSGVGGFSAVNFDENLETPINLITPFIIDRSNVDDVRQSYVRPDYSFATVGAINVTKLPNSVAAFAGAQAPGARIAFAAGNIFNAIPSDITIDGAVVRATAGTIDIKAVGSIYLKSDASLQTPGYTRTFDDGIDKTVVSANGGAINLISTGGGTIIDAASTSSLIVDNGIGKAGTLNIAASDGDVKLLAQLNPGVAAGMARNASFFLDAGQSEFALGAFVSAYGNRFQGDIAIRSGTGNLSLDAGRAMIADSVSLTADGGIVSIAGLIDTSGDNVTGIALTDPRYKDARIDGGNISLFGRNGVALASTASLLSLTNGYGARDARQASGGNVTIGIGIPELPGQLSALSIATGAKIDVGAIRPGNRLISEFVTDQLTQIESTIYRLAQGDRGGLVSFRAPVLSDKTISFTNQGQITGARDVSIEAYRRFDLDAIVNGGEYSGVGLRFAFPADMTTLDAREVLAGKPNFLTDLAAGTIPDFVRNFAVMGPNGASLDEYRVRPGVELNSVNGIRLLSNWNLGAGQIVNADGTPGFQDAVAAGLMVESPLGSYTSGPLIGQRRNEVVFGKEAELYERFVDMTYRVNGDVRGEAPVVTLRAEGNLEIRNSISDGFFAFHDLTNPDFINYQLGGGDRAFSPALNIVCGVGDAAACADSQFFKDISGGPLAGPGATRITIQIGIAQQGSDTQPYVNAPYNPLANMAAPGGTGDPLGVAELFPLFEDGSSARSSGINLVAGATNGSANPLQINLSRTGSVTVSGETSYEITGTRGTGRLAGPLQLAFNGPEVGNVDRTLYSLDELLALIDSGTDPEYNAEFYTVLNWGVGSTGAAADARNRALAYGAFEQFLGPKNNPTGVQARLRDVIAFLKDSGFAEAYRRGIEQKLPGFRSVANILAPTVALRSDTAYVGTTVRTGDGSINIAAANNIDLRKSAGALLRAGPQNINEKAQVGGTAVYTAGVRVASADLGGAILPEAQPAVGSYVPGPLSGLRITPVFSKNGGSIWLNAGNDVLGRRDVWNEIFGEQGSQLSSSPRAVTVGGLVPSTFGANSPTQRWRYGQTANTNTFAAIAPNFFTSGVGALGGGDVTLRAGRDVTDLTIALNNSLVTGSTDSIQTLVTLGAGDLALAAGRNLNGGQFDIASGSAFARVGGNVDAAGTTSTLGSFQADNRNLLRIRVADATFDLTAKGSVTVAGLGALGVAGSQLPGAQLSNVGFFSSIAGAELTGTVDVAIIGNRPDQILTTANNVFGFVLPPSLSLHSINGDISFGNGVNKNLFSSNVMYASEYGQLSLLAGGDISNFALAMSDAAPSHFFGGDTLLTASFPGLRSTSDNDLRILHNRRITHLNDLEPARILAAGSINLADISLPKQARISAGDDIVDLYFQGQNVREGDVTRVNAGRDIVGTTVLGINNLSGRSIVLGNSIIVGGPGALFVEAGRDLGPFVTSTGQEAGGIRTIGNEANPWLTSQGADIYAFFGVGKGTQYDALQSAYLDPANLVRLDGDLFEQNKDVLGNKSPDRTRYTYAPLLAEWLRQNRPALFQSVFGNTAPSSADVYARYSDVYAAFAGLDQLTRNRFLIDKVYFGELAVASDPKSESFNQFIRGYRAVETLFPARLGYTDNLATYRTDPSTINADHPLGVPTKILVNGQPLVATKVETGNVDLRLSTLQTARGGDITILGPGGNFIAGSVVRTEAQLARRAAVTRGIGSINRQDLLVAAKAIDAIPLGSEGILTLRGGEVRSFTDGNFVLNQSRLFTQRGGDITLWSSNGDLNAGQGPKSSSNFPPITLRFSPSGFSEVDSAGSVSGAGIAAFRPSPEIEPASVRLIAPVGTVDAGDAGVRASGNVFVAAARVANADNFAAGGTISGVPSIGTPAAPAVPASAASAIAANAFRAADAIGQGADRLSRIFVDVLGYFGGGDKCPDGAEPDANGVCKPEEESTTR